MTSGLWIRALIGEVFGLTLKQVIFSFFLLSCSFAKGQSGRLMLNYLTLAETKKDIGRNHLELDLSYRYQRKKPVYKKLGFYPQSISNIHPTTDFSFNDEEYFSPKDEQYLDFVFDVGFYGVTYTDYAFLLPEAYLDLRLGSSSFIVGRKIPQIKLFIDSLWKQGVDQAFFRMNPFDAKEQGRLAATYLLESDTVMVEAFVSPFSIPDQGPSFNFQNGQATSNNPWASDPPTQVNLSDTGLFNLSYQIEDAAIPDIITNMQYGLALAIVSDYIKIDGFYYNKSSKQIGLTLDPKLNSDSVGDIDVIAKPFFINEHLFGVQLESKWFEEFRMTNGFYGMAIDTSDLEDDVSYRTEISDYFFISTGFHFDLKKAKLTMAHMYRRERPFVEENTVYFNNMRFLHGNAVKLLLDDLKYKRFSFRSEVLFGTQDKGVFVEAGVNYKKSAHLSFNAQLNLIQDFADSEAQSALSESVFSKFSELDNIRLGVQYVF